MIQFKSNWFTNANEWGCAWLEDSRQDLNSLFGKKKSERQVGFLSSLKIPIALVGRKCDFTIRKDTLLTNIGGHFLGFFPCTLFYEAL